MLPKEEIKLAIEGRKGGSSIRKVLGFYPWSIGRMFEELEEELRKLSNGDVVRYEAELKQG